MINKKGFTLMELIVTVILVAVLASYAVYHYTNVMDEGKVNGAKGKLAALGGATQRFLLENGTPAPFNEANPHDFKITIDNINANCDNNSCNNAHICGIFTCEGFAEKNIGFDSNFDFYFAKNPCGIDVGITVKMEPIEDNENFPKCAYFDPNTDTVIEVNE